MRGCDGCIRRNTYMCMNCVGWNKYESNTLFNATLISDINKEMKMLEKAKLNNLFGVKSTERKIDMRIEKVIFNAPATVVFWKDGSKTIVKSGDYDIYDPEKGLAMAIAKKALGNQGNYYEVFKKWLPDEKDEEELSPLDKLKQVLANLTIPKLSIADSKDETDAVSTKFEVTHDADSLKVSAETVTERKIQWLSAKEVAEANGLSVECVRKQIKDGFIPLAEKINGKWKIPCYVFDDHVEVKCM